MMKNVAVFLYENVELLDFAGPAEVLAVAGFNVYTVARDHAPLRSQGFLTVVPEFSFEDCPTPDILVIPGGDGRKMSRDAGVVEWVRKLAPSTGIAFSVCTGALVLGAAGLLEGLPATTHWEAVVELRMRFPQTEVRERERFIDTGRVLTTQGVSAGIDGALHLVERLLGAEKARSVARYLQYAWQDSESTLRAALLTKPA